MGARIERVLVATLASCFLAAPVFSQALTGAITGRVLDSSNAVMPGVEVDVSSPSLKIRTT